VTLCSHDVKVKSIDDYVITLAYNETQVLTADGIENWFTIDATCGAEDRRVYNNP